MYLRPRSALTPDYKARLRETEWLSSRSTAFQDALLSLGGITELGAGTTLYKRGYALTHLHGLIQGQIDVILHEPTTGKEVSSPSTTAGKWFSFGDLITDAPPIATAIARVPTIVLRIPRQEFMRFLQEKPERYADIIAYENTARRAAQTHYISALTSSGEAKIASLLLHFHNSNWLNPNEPITIAQQELSALAGSSVPTVQRAFRKLKRLGIIETDYGRVVVRDIERLRQFSEGAET